MGAKEKKRCYYCGETNATSREHIPGQLFGVSGTQNGLIVPACHDCNGSWDADQQFFRLRIVLHAGSDPAAKYIHDRELLRLKGSPKKKPQVGRYRRERAKTFRIRGVEYIGLTDADYQRTHNVARHWAAGLHFHFTGDLAALPGEIKDTIARPKLDPQKVIPKLIGHPTGAWSRKDGEFVRWWFIRGEKPGQSVCTFRVLQRNPLWFLVRF